MPSPLLFSIWCVLENSFVHFFMFDFLLRVTRKEGGRWLPIWLIGNGLITWTVSLLQLPGTFPLDVLVLFFFARAALPVRGAELAAPVTIVFTLYTFAEGYSAFILSWASAHLRSTTGGLLEQAAVTLFLDLLFFLALQTIRQKYADALRQPIASYLYVLLLPCAMIVPGVRYGLRLDSRDLAGRFSSFAASVRLTVFLTLLAAVILVFFIIGVFCKIIRLSAHEKAAALLQSQLNGQRVYLEEAMKRNAFYSAFQHDIDNHLLVISGLLQDKRFAQAERYTEKLRAGSTPLLMRLSTGNPALDVLLREKLSYAKRSQITVNHDVGIPGDFRADDIDLCVLFSNILDNAITACLEQAPEGRSLSISAKGKGRLLLVEAVNTTAAVQAAPFGVGLNNVRHIAELYQGTLETELKNGRFRISVLLCSR